MERIISYDELPTSRGQSIYLRMETDPKLYISLLSKGYKIVNNIVNANQSTIYITGQRQVKESFTFEDYKDKVDTKIRDLLKQKDITKPKTIKFSYDDLIKYNYQVPFVLKNENQNGGREKFLIATEEDYKNLIKACTILIERKILNTPYSEDDIRNQIDYNKYLNLNFSIQEYIKTPSKYNTTVRVLTSSSDDLLYAALKYKEQSKLMDDTSLLGYLLTEVYPLSTNSIVSNTLSGGKNILLGEKVYSNKEKDLLESHNIESNDFNNLIDASSKTHKECKKELGILCGFDYIYDEDKNKWYLLEYHSKPMVGDYSIRQNIPYRTKEDRIAADGHVRATALALELKKTR